MCENSMDFIKIAIQEAPGIIGGSSPTRGLGFISGDTREDKSLPASHLAVCVSRGEPVLGFRTKSTAVIFVDH